MPDSYKNLAEIARTHGVSAAAVTGWTKKSTWPGTLDKASVDRFVEESINPHRRGKQRKQNPAPVMPALSPHPAPTPPPPAATPPLDDESIQTASLADLERMIRRATNPDVAERLSKQVRALKVVQEIRQREGETLDASVARTEISSTFHFFRTTLLNLPRSLAKSLEAMRAEEIETILAGRMAEVIGELQRGLQHAVEFDATDPTPVDRNIESAGHPGEASAEPDGGTISGTPAAADESAGAME